MNYMLKRMTIHQRWIIEGECKICGKKYQFTTQENSLCDKHYTRWIRKQKLKEIEKCQMEDQKQ